MKWDPDARLAECSWWLPDERLTAVILLCTFDFCATLLPGFSTRFSFCLFEGKSRVQFISNLISMYGAPIMGWFRSLGLPQYTKQVAVLVCTEFTFYEGKQARIRWYNAEWVT